MRGCGAWGCEKVLIWLGYPVEIKDRCFDVAAKEIQITVWSVVFVVALCEQFRGTLFAIGGEGLSHGCGLCAEPGKTALCEGDM